MPDRARSGRQWTSATTPLARAEEAERQIAEDITAPSSRATQSIATRFCSHCCISSRHGTPGPRDRRARCRGPPRWPSSSSRAVAAALLSSDPRVAAAELADHRSSFDAPGDAICGLRESWRLR